jgi:hypothetical protein
MQELSKNETERPRATHRATYPIDLRDRREYDFMQASHFAIKKWWTAMGETWRFVGATFVATILLIVWASSALSATIKAARTPTDVSDAAEALALASVPDDWRGGKDYSTTQPVEKGVLAITSGFEGSSSLNARRISESHYVIKLGREFGVYFLLFRVQGASGKTMRFDLEPLARRAGWGGANPVFSNCDRLDDPESFPAFHLENPPDRLVRAGNGSVLPSTSSENWHFASDVWRESDRLCFTHHFTADSTYFALRVPYNPSLNERILAGFDGIKGSKLWRIGKSAEHRPLLLIEIGDSTESQEHKHPCILVLAREHGCEPDPSWAAEGIVRFLLSDDPAATSIRKEFTILVAPIEDSDGAANVLYNNIIDSFNPESATPESRAYSTWFKAWVDAGKRLDLVLNLHNPAPRRSFNLACPLMEPVSSRGPASDQLHRLILKAVSSSGYSVDPQPWERGYSKPRLSGWLQSSFGSLVLPYEIHSQASSRHLDISDLRTIGRDLIATSVRFLSSKAGAVVLAGIDDRRKLRLAYGQQINEELTGLDALSSERAISQKAQVGLKSSKSTGAAAAPNKETEQ